MTKQRTEDLTAKMRSTEWGGAAPSSVPNPAAAVAPVATTGAARVVRVPPAVPVHVAAEVAPLAPPPAEVEEENLDRKVTWDW